MPKLKHQILTLCLLFALASNAAAESSTSGHQQPQDAATDRSTAIAHPTMVEDTDGNLTAGEFEVISPNGSITRSACPYNCESRGLEKADCREWRSNQDPQKCYVQDTRIPSEAVSFSKR